LIHAFILMVLIADAQQPNPMYFRSINVCQYYAKRVVQQYGNYGYSSIVPAEHRITAYCKPMKVNPKTTLLYDH
jgi:hypothetical protein